MLSRGMGWRIRRITVFGLAMGLFAHAQSGIAVEQCPDCDNSLVELVAAGVLPGFPGWVSRRELFAALPAQPTLINGSVPLVVTTHFNRAAAQHIRQLGLHRPGALATLAESGTTQLPALPKGAQIAMAAWWPVAGNGFTPLPVWRQPNGGHPEPRIENAHGNGYLNWDTVVAVSSGGATAEPGRLVFAGRLIEQPVHSPLDDMVFKTLDRHSVAALMAQPAARKLSGLVLGRAMETGDHLALVALHLFSADGRQGRWETHWWQPETVADGPTPSLPPPWNRYQSDAVIDAVVPRERDGSPNIGFNPWFEGGLVPSDQGRPGESNCLSCHARAAYPADDFLTITRGVTQPAANAVATGMVWSLAIAHRPLAEVARKP